MAPLHLLCEGNAGRSEVQGHNNICIQSEKNVGNDIRLERSICAN